MGSPWNCSTIPTRHDCPSTSDSDSGRFGWTMGKIVGLVGTSSFQSFKHDLFMIHDSASIKETCYRFLSSGNYFHRPTIIMGLVSFPSSTEWQSLPVSFVVLMLTSSLFIWYHRNYHQGSNLPLPPGPKKLPFIGNALVRDDRWFLTVHS